MLKRLPVLALLLALCLLAASTTARATSGAAAAPLMTAFAKHGWIFGVRSDGTRIRLTAGTNAVDPLLSPDRSSVAYFTANRHGVNRDGGAFLNGVWTVGTRANRQHLVANLDGPGAGALAWSPDGRMLAFVHGRALSVWSGSATGSSIVRQLNRDPTLNSEPAMAWSPDGRRIAVPLPSVSLQRPPESLSVAIVDIPGGASRVIRVNFPRRLMGSQTTALGSHPTSNQIGWSTGGLLVATAINGAGNSLTGIWTVRASGGLAHLLYGNPTVVDRRQSVPALLDATHFLVSPDGRRLATDPGHRFWINMQGGAHGHFLAPYQAVGCSIAQWRWLVGGQGLAYVTLCTVGGTTNFRSTLYTISLQNGHPRLIVTVVSRNLTALALATSVRCVACA